MTSNNYHSRDTRRSRYLVRSRSKIVSESIMIFQDLLYTKWIDMNRRLKRSIIIYSFDRINRKTRVRMEEHFYM